MTMCSAVCSECEQWQWQTCIVAFCNTAVHSQTSKEYPFCKAWQQAKNPHVDQVCKAVCHWNPIINCVAHQQLLICAKWPGMGCRLYLEVCIFACTAMSRCVLCHVTTCLQIALCLTALTSAYYATPEPGSCM